LTPDSPRWTGVKFLITAEHVLRGKSKVVIRLNRDDNAGFTCFPMELKWDGKEENAFVSRKPEVDLAAIYLPKIPDTDPWVIDYSLILDAKSMSSWQVEDGAARRELGVESGPAALLLVISVILLCPLFAMVLLWASQKRLGLIFLTVSMAASLVFGLYNHFACRRASSRSVGNRICPHGVPVVSHRSHGNLYGPLFFLYRMMRASKTVRWVSRVTSFRPW